MLANKQNQILCKLSRRNGELKDLEDWLMLVYGLRKTVTVSMIEEGTTDVDSDDSKGILVKIDKQEIVFTYMSIYTKYNLLDAFSSTGELLTGKKKTDPTIINKRRRELLPK